MPQHSWSEIDQVILSHYLLLRQSARQVAAHLDWQIPMHAIYMRARAIRIRLGLPHDRTTPKKVDWELVPELLAETATVAEIAEFFGVSEYRIRYGRQPTSQLRERAKARARSR